MDILKRKKMKFLNLVIIVIIGLVWFSIAIAADIQKKLINYQGYLVDNANQPVPLDGTYDITFRIYVSPINENPIWTELHSSVTIIQGNISVLLGTITDMDLAFDEARYLGIQVGTKPEMSPRQRLLPSFQATSANCLNVTHANGNKSEYDINQIVPIGLISFYYGNPFNLPDNWRICDGSTINDAESLFNGVRLPDLRKRFVRGEEDTTRDIIENLLTGGSDTIPGHSHTINIQPAGSHNHTGSTGSGGVNHTHVVSGTTGETSGSSPTYLGENFDASDKWHTHTFTITSEGASKYMHTHPILTDGEHTHEATIGSTSIPHLPSYVALHYIIRIK